MRGCLRSRTEKTKAARKLRAGKYRYGRKSTTETARRSLPVSSFASAIWWALAPGGSYKESLYRESPRKDTHPQACQSDGESAQSWTLFTQSGGLWNRHLALETMMPQWYGVLSGGVSCNTKMPGAGRFTIAACKGELARVLEAESTVRPMSKSQASRESKKPNPDKSPLSRTQVRGPCQNHTRQCYLVTPDFPDVPAVTLRHKNPYLAFARAVEIFYQPPALPEGIHSTAVIHPTATLGKQPRIGAYAVVGENVVIGDDAIILPHVVIYPGVRIGHRFFAHAHAVVRENCRLGDDVVLQNGVVVGSDGFGFAKDERGRWYKIRSPGPPSLAIALKFRPMPVSTAPASVQPASATASRSTTWCRSATAHRSTRTALLCAQVGLAGALMSAKT